MRPPNPARVEAQAWFRGRHLRRGRIASCVRVSAEESRVRAPRMFLQHTPAGSRWLTSSCAAVGPVVLRGGHQKRGSMSQSRDDFAGAFDAVEPADFTEVAVLAAKLAPLEQVFNASKFDLEEFVDRCVRRTENRVMDEPFHQLPTAFLACDGQDVSVTITEGEPMLDFLDRLHEEVTRVQATAAFVVKSVEHGWSSPADGINTPTPALFFYSESRSGAVIHGFWRVTGRGMDARLTECYKIRGSQPNQIMHRIISGPDQGQD